MIKFFRLDSQALPQNFAQQARAFLALTKPRVVSLIVFTAVIGMLFATPGAVPLQVLLAGTSGIALVAGAAAAILHPRRRCCRRSRARASPRSATRRFLPNTSTSSTRSAT